MQGLKRADFLLKTFDFGGWKYRFQKSWQQIEDLLFSPQIRRFLDSYVLLGN